VKKNIDSREIKWGNCIRVCTDGAHLMLGCKKGFVAYVLKVSLNVKIVHCMIHQEALLTQALRQLFEVKLTSNKNFRIVM
jgi:hypothetical protein